MYQEPEREADAIEETGDIIIAGHGRVGGIVNRMLRSFGFETTVIDFNSATSGNACASSIMKIYYGDATRPDLLLILLASAHAKLLVIAIDNKDQITELVKYMVKHHPQMFTSSPAPSIAFMSTTFILPVAATSFAIPMTVRSAPGARRWRRWGFPRNGQLNSPASSRKRTARR